MKYSTERWREPQLSSQAHRISTVVANTVSVAFHLINRSAGLRQSHSMRFRAPLILRTCLVKLLLGYIAHGVAPFIGALLLDCMD